VVTLPVVLFALAGGAWGLACDRIAVRWPEHDEPGLPGGRAPGWRTAVAVALGALGLGLVPVRFAGPAELALFGAYIAALTLLLATDLDQRLLPNEITLPAIPLALAAAVAGANPLVPPGEAAIAAIAAIAVPALLFVVAIPFGAGAIGLGDLKLLVSVGLTAGAWRLVMGVIWGCLLAGVVIALLLVARRVTLRSFIPFGPFLIVGAFWAILGPG